MATYPSRDPQRFGPVHFLRRPGVETPTPAPAEIAPLKRGTSRIALLIALALGGAAGWFANDQWGRARFVAVNPASGPLRLDTRTGQTWKLYYGPTRWVRVEEP